MAMAFSMPGLAEMIALGVLALLIFGPERLPGMARNAGRTLARFKQEASTTLDELKRTAELDELRGVADELRSTGRDLKSAGRELQATGSELSQAAALPAAAAASRRDGPAPQAASDPHGDAAPYDPDAT